jgi:hypothetical protein
MTRCVVILGILFVGCGTVRTPFSGGADEHVGEIACHGVLLPAKGAPRALFLCAGGVGGCEASRGEQIKKGYTVSDCSPHPHAVCMASDSGQICLGSLGECREFATSASRDPESCTAYDSERGERAGAFSGMYESSRGDAAVLRTGNSIDVRGAKFAMQCSLAGTTATCTWSEGDKKGQSTLEQQTDGSWASGSDSFSLRRKR